LSSKQEEAEEKSTNNSLSKLLVAIDGSESSDYALNLAIHIGEAFSSKVDLIYVYAPSVPPPVSTPLYDPLSVGPVLSPLPEWQAQGVHKKTLRDEALVEQRKRLVEERNLECVATAVESDDIGGEIIKLSSSGGYDLVVLGSRGLSGLRSLILGSVSKKVAKEAKTSVLVVKNRVDRLPKILVGYDGSPEAKKALNLAGDIGVRFHGQVDPIGVVAIPVSHDGMVIPDSVSKWEKEMRDEIRKGIEILKQHGVAKSEGKIVDSPDVARGIVEEAERESYDLIAVGNRGYGRLKAFFLGSVASGVADNSKTNVLIVR
jgi:nucleotide-binding universal stress UspA family protein